jgi:hypothetical protein
MVLKYQRHDGVPKMNDLLGSVPKMSPKILAGFEE